MELRDIGRSVVEVGISVGIILSAVGVGQFLIRMAAARRLIENPDDVNAGALLLMF